MKICYIILAHKNPKQLIRLIKRLDTPKSSFLIHIDRQLALAEYTEVVNSFQHSSNVHFLKRYRCYWGSFNLIDVVLSAINKLLELQIDFNYAFLLSGQDYLIKPLDSLDNFLASNQGQQFLECFSLIEPNKWSSGGGYFQALNRVQHYYIRFRSRLIRIPIKRRFPYGFIPYGGSQWWCLSRDCLQYINDFIIQKPKFINYFKYVFIPDECFFQSLLANSPYQDKIYNNDLKYTDWSNHNPTPPAILDVSYLSILKETSAFFARKFDTNRDSKILDLIDREIIEVH